MRNDVIDRSAVVPAITQTLNTIIQDMQMYSIPMESKDARLRRYGKMLSAAINKIPSAGINEVTVLPEGIGIVCGALAKEDEPVPEKTEATPWVTVTVPRGGQT